MKNKENEIIKQIINNIATDEKVYFFRNEVMKAINTDLKDVYDLTKVSKIFYKDKNKENKEINLVMLGKIDVNFIQQVLVRSNIRTIISFK